MWLGRRPEKRKPHRLPLLARGSTRGVDMTDEEFLKLYNVEFSDDQCSNSIDSPFGIEHFSGFQLVKVTEKSCEYPKKMTFIPFVRELWDSSPEYRQDIYWQVGENFKNLTDKPD